MSSSSGNATQERNEQHPPVPWSTAKQQRLQTSQGIPRESCPSPLNEDECTHHKMQINKENIQVQPFYPLALHPK
jgi:hypothetical protein